MRALKVNNFEMFVMPILPDLRSLAVQTRKSNLKVKQKHEN